MGCADTAVHKYISMNYELFQFSEEDCLLSDVKRVTPKHYLVSDQFEICRMGISLTPQTITPTNGLPAKKSILLYSVKSRDH